MNLMSLGCYAHSGEGDASKGFICWTLGSLRVKEAQSALEELVDSASEMELYRNRRLTRVTLGALAREALQTIQTEKR